MTPAARLLRDTYAITPGARLVRCDEREKNNYQYVALEIDPAYISYGAYRSLAGYYGSLPPLFGQNLPRALSYLCPVITEPATCVECAACPFDPDCNLYFENRLIFAQYYLMKKSEWTESARVLQSILDEPAGELHPLYNVFDQVLARELLADVQKHL